MTHNQLVDEACTFRDAANKMLSYAKFDIEKMERGEPFHSWCDRGWTEYMPDNKSGVYLIRWPEDTVIYIGKATKENLGAEVWGKFKKWRVDSTGVKDFYQSHFISEKLYPDMDPQTREAIRQGNVFFTFLIVNPVRLSSLLEVYLQTAYEAANNGKLPILNRRIG